jgi:hypothetical protein
LLRDPRSFAPGLASEYNNPFPYGPKDPEALLRGPSILFSLQQHSTLFILLKFRHTETTTPTKAPSVYPTITCQDRKKRIPISIDTAIIPSPKGERKPPVVFSTQEVTALLKSCDNLKHRYILSVIHAGGLRLAEVVHLKQPDIDNGSLQIFACKVKRKKDQYTCCRKKLPHSSSKTVPTCGIFRNCPDMPVQKQPKFIPTLHHIKLLK